MAVETALEYVAHSAAGAHHVHESAREAIPEIPNVITLLYTRLQGHSIVGMLHHWDDLAFAIFIGVVMCAIALRYARRPSNVPSGWQNVLELFVDSVDALVQRIIGRAGRTHTPFIGTLFIYIWLMNLSILVPGLESPTASLNTTMGLALVVFCYVQLFAIRSNGLIGHVDHLAGYPRTFVGWAMVPLMLPIHLLGELIKPLSLSLRLAFNIFAEDVLLAVLLGLGLSAGIALHFPVGFPIQFFVVPLIIIFSTVQALVFSLLSTVYISLMVPQAEHH